MKTWKGQSRWAEMVILALGTALVAFCLIGPLWWPVSASAQKAAGTGKTAQPAQPTKQLTPLQADLQNYLHKGYSAIGPVTLTLYDGRSVGVFQSSGDIVIGLRDKKFTVKDGYALPASVNLIKRGGKVILCYGPNEVIVYVPERKGGGTDEAH